MTTTWIFVTFDVCCAIARANVFHGVRKKVNLVTPGQEKMLLEMSPILGFDPPMSVCEKLGSGWICRFDIDRHRGILLPTLSMPIGTLFLTSEKWNRIKIMQAGGTTV